MNNRKRQKECPNPLFLKWLEEWRDEAKQKNSKLQYTYGKAAAALKKYPLPLSSGKDAMILDNIGEMIARRLDQAMAKYGPSNQEEERYSRNPYPMLESLSVPLPPVLVLDGNDTKQTTPKKKQARKKSTREYIPAYKSGPYALMLTLFRQSQRTNYRGYMTRPELQKEAQPLCDASFTVPDQGSHYTAWSSMSTLIKKGFILKTNNPARYSLTDAGCALAEKLETISGDSLSPNSTTSSVSDSIQPPLSGSSDFKSKGSFSLAATSVMTNSSHTQRVCIDVEEPADKKEFRNHHNFTSVQKRKEEMKPKIDEDVITFTPDFVLRPGTFDVILCVDINETTAGQTNSRKATLVPELKKNGVQFDVRKLQLGDFLWIARERTVPTPGCLSVPVARELVLDYIVERKRMDDLCGSIIDGRFREQKFRLGHCGLKHPVYLVEDFGSIQHMSLPETTLKQAIINTQAESLGELPAKPETSLLSPLLFKGPSTFSLLDPNHLLSAPSCHSPLVL